MSGIRIGVVGAGSFARSFIPLFQAHPQVADVTVTELLPDRRQAVCERFGVQRSFDSFEATLDADLDAIALFTQRHLHGELAIAALKRGKHVYSAVPMAGTVEEIRQIVEIVDKTRLTYMMGETSYYYPTAVYCRKRFQAGEFGHFVYGEGEYLHDMSHGFYDAFKHSGGDDWQRVAGFPPMYYPTHSTSMIISVTGAHFTTVSCLGYRDRSDDGVFGVGKNNWDNVFSNESALFRTSDGGMCRVNEFRRIADGRGRSVRTSIYGTLGCFEEKADTTIWTTLDRKLENLDDQLRCSPTDEAGKKALQSGEQLDFYSGIAPVHTAQRLPRSFQGLSNGHYGSHQFLVDDFVRAVVQQKLPPNHAWASARYTIPGLIAHESALREGALIDIPDYGDAPADWPLADLGE